MISSVNSIINFIKLSQYRIDELYDKLKVGDFLIDKRNPNNGLVYKILTLNTPGNTNNNPARTVTIRNPGRTNINGGSIQVLTINRVNPTSENIRTANKNFNSQLFINLDPFIKLAFINHYAQTNNTIDIPLTDLSTDNFSYANGEQVANTISSLFDDNYYFTFRNNRFIIEEKNPELGYIKLKSEGSDFSYCVFFDELDKLKQTNIVRPDDMEDLLQGNTNDIKIGDILLFDIPNKEPLRVEVVSINPSNIRQFLTVKLDDGRTLIVSKERAKSARKEESNKLGTTTPDKFIVRVSYEGLEKLLELAKAEILKLVPEITPEQLTTELTLFSKEFALHPSKLMEYGQGAPLNFGSKYITSTQLIPFKYLEINLQNTETNTEKAVGWADFVKMIDVVKTRGITDIKSGINLILRYIFPEMDKELRTHAWIEE